MQIGQRCDFRRNIDQILKVKRAKKIFFDPQRPYFPRKIQWFSRFFAEAKERFEKLVKYVPLGHQKALWGRFRLQNTVKYVSFAIQKGEKRQNKKGGSKNDDSTAKRRPPLEK